MLSGSPQIAYGVDFAASSCTIVRATKRGRAVQFETLVTAKPANDPSVVTLAASIAADQTSGRASLNIAAPAQDSVIRMLATPFASSAKARAVLPSLLDVQLPFPLEQCSCQFITPPQPRGSTIRATAVAIPSDRLAEVMEAQRQAGFDADIIDHEAIALWRHAALPSGEETAAKVVLYLGDDRTVAIVGHGCDPSASFSARTSFRPDGDPVALDKLVLRIRQFIAGALGQSAGIEPRFIVCGPLARQQASGLARRLDVPAERFRQIEHAESALARSLAAAALTPDDWSVNLRTGASEHPSLQQRRMKVGRRNHTAVRVAAILLITVCLGATSIIGRLHDRQQAAVQSSARTITGAAVIPRGQELFITEQFVAGAEERFRPFRQWLEPTAYPLFTTLMTLAHDKGQQLETVSVRADAIVIRGSGADWNDPELLAQVVRKEGWTVEIERAEAGLDERVHYTMRASR